MHTLPTEVGKKAAHDEKIGPESMAPIVVYDLQHPHCMMLKSFDLLPKLYIADENEINTAFKSHHYTFFILCCVQFNYYQRRRRQLRV